MAKYTQVLLDGSVALAHGAAPGGTADGNYPGSLVGYGGAKDEASYPGAIVLLVEGSVVYTQTATGAGSYEVGT